MTITAVFQDGVFRPEVPVHLAEGTRVDVTIQAPAADPVAILMARYPSFGSMNEEDARAMEQVIEEACERINPDAWK